jgi:hypothetical protein
MLLCALLGFQLSPLIAQDCPCCDPVYHQFDFWAGDWEVYDSLGQEVGRNTITREQAGCLLVENWTSSTGGTGTSYNYYNPADSTWNQLWVDSQGGILELKGGIREGAMVLRSQLLDNSGNAPFYHQIRWEQDGAQVIQTWETLDENHRIVALLFKGFYKAISP